MKKLLTAKSLSLLMLLSLFGGKAEAGRNYEDGYVSESRDCCMSSCYECGCNPLYCGAWDLQIQGGVQPIIWNKRSNVFAVDCALLPASAVVDLSRGPKFNHLFKTPWIVGGQIGYHWSDNTRVYVEFNYSQAKGKHDYVADALVTTYITSINYNLHKYKLYDAYVGARYYWDRWCDRVAFFLGGKIGLTHHKKLYSPLLTFNVTSTVTSTIADQEIYRSNTVVSGGADFGFDVCFCGNWSFVVTGAVIASCGPRPVDPIALNPVNVGGLSVLIGGHVQTELRFPVTAGIRYSF